MGEYKNDEGKMKIFLTLFIIASFGFTAWRLKWLSRGGALTASGFGFFLLQCGSLEWIIPVLLFFFFSSLLSKFRRRSIAQSEKNDDSRRTAMQVLANGGVAWAMLLGHVFFPNPLWFIGFLGSIAGATADTWGTEIGRLSNGRAISVLTGKSVPRGTSGGVSWQGTLGGIAGAILIAAYPCLATDKIGIDAGIMIVGAGAAGSLVDSLVGALFQVRYIDDMGEISELAGKDRNYYSGWRWMTNDAVNICCTVTGAVVAVLLYYFL